MALKSATTTLATIQMRRGAEENFDPDQMTAGEWAVSTDSKKVWMCFMPGLVLRMATYEAFEKDMEEIRAILVEAQDIQLAIQTWFKLAESYAHGGTGAREGEDTDNAKYYAEQAKISADNAAAVADIGIMTTEKVGIGKPDGTTITVDEDGTMHSAGGSGTDIGIATTQKAGIVKPDGETVTIDEDGTIHASGGASGDFASKAIYGDDAISLGRKEGETIGTVSVAFGQNVTASNRGAVAFGGGNISSGDCSFSAGWGNEAQATNAVSFGSSNKSLGNNSVSFGNNNISVDNYSFSEGCGNIALGYGSHVEGAQNISGAKYVLKIASYNSEAKTFTFDDTYTGFSESFAQLAAGVRLHIANVYYINIASVYTILSVGSDGKSVVVNESIPTSNFSVYLATIIKSGTGYVDCHSEGRENISLNDYTHSEGNSTKSLGNCSHSEGYKTTASGKRSHAGGTSSTASGEDSFAHGNNATSTAKGSFSCGINTTASGEGSFCCGVGSSASGTHSHAEGGYTSANGWQSHSEGRETTANGNFSHSEGFHTTSLHSQHAQGHYNDTSKATAGSSEGTSNGTAFVIGNGTSTTPSNAARIDYKGKLWCKQAYSSTGADYAELFEWADGNQDNEDRRGYFVTVEGKKIKKAQAGDYILGIISGNPSVIGNTDMEWYGQFMRDEFGTFLKENYKETITEPVIDEEGNVTEEEKEVDVEFYKVNPDYDPDAPYTFRLDRPEWDAVGMLGVLPVRDDGTCEVGKFCKCADGGIATLATERGFDTYMVIDRVSENIVSVVLK